MSNPTLQVDGYLRKNKAWQPELQALRTLILTTGLTEEVKWRVPCYTDNGRNILILGAFKDSCVLSFVKGVLLKDPDHLLLKPGENSHIVRVIRFTDAGQIRKLQKTLKAYIHEAIALERAGVKPQTPKNPEPPPDELQSKLDHDPAFAKAFHALTPGRQRAYILTISAAKQPKTRTARVEKYTPKILAGKGLLD